jgi:hypothetical protein
VKALGSALFSPVTVLALALAVTGSGGKSAEPQRLVTATGPDPLPR